MSPTAHKPQPECDEQHARIRDRAIDYLGLPVTRPVVPSAKRRRMSMRSGGMRNCRPTINFTETPMHRISASTACRRDSGTCSFVTAPDG